MYPKLKFTETSLLDFKKPLRPTAPCVDLDQMVLGLYDLVAWNKSKQKNSTLRRHEDN